MTGTCVGVHTYGGPITRQNVRRMRKRRIKDGHYSPRPLLNEWDVIGNLINHIKHVCKVPVPGPRGEWHTHTRFCNVCKVYSTFPPSSYSSLLDWKIALTNFALIWFSSWCRRRKSNFRQEGRGPKSPERGNTRKRHKAVGKGGGTTISQLQLERDFEMMLYIKIDIRLVDIFFSQPHRIHWSSNKSLGRIALQQGQFPNYGRWVAKTTALKPSNSITTVGTSGEDAKKSRIQTSGDSWMYRWHRTQLTWDYDFTSSGTTTESVSSGS